MIHLELLRYELKAKRRSILYFCLGLIAWGGLITSLYPTVSGIEAFSDYWGQFPDTLKNLFGGHEINILRAEGYITLEYYQLFLPLIIAAFAFSFAAFCVARARENGTLEILLSHPIERRDYAITSFVALTAGVALLTLVAVGTVMIVSFFLNIDISYAGQLEFAASVFLLNLGLGGACLFASCALKGVGQVYAVGVTLFAASYLVNFLANNWTVFRILDHGLPFHYYDPYATMTSGGFSWTGVAYHLPVAIIFATLSVLALQRKDIVN